MLDDLRKMFPWPATIPEVDDRCVGWFAGENANRLKELLTPETKVVYEAGSFHGMSSRFICQCAPNAVVFCNDTWLGSMEHFRRPEWLELLPTLYDTFLRNLSPWKDRVVPMRCLIQDGMQLLADHRVKPDVCYIDGSHDEESVYQDVTRALKLFPGAEIVGDDWTWSTVAAGVRRAAGARKIVNGAVNWWIPKQ